MYWGDFGQQKWPRLQVDPSTVHHLRVALRVFNLVKLRGIGVCLAYSVTEQ